MCFLQLSFLNSQACNLSFTGQLKSDCNWFFGRTVNTCIQTGWSLKSYRKALAGSRLLSARSSHPKTHHPGYSSWPISQTLEYLQWPISLGKGIAASFKRFLARGYSRWTLDRASCIVNRKNRADLLHKGNPCRKKNQKKNHTHL